MTPRPFPTLSVLLALAGAALGASCGGDTDSGSSTGPVSPGDPCDREGERRDSVDGCNTCTCSGGAWACTEMACPTDGGAGKGCGGWLGDTCSDTEYCAYDEGQHCGAADASSVCRPRPMACDTVYAPVCGCDGQTHGNACEAAASGTGVLHAGVCE